MYLCGSNKHTLEFEGRDIAVQRMGGLTFRDENSKLNDDGDESESDEDVVGGMRMRNVGEWV